MGRKRPLHDFTNIYRICNKHGELSGIATMNRANHVERLTLDSAAQAAGVSKGGLLHHFPNKDELIKAVITETADEFDAQVEARAAGAQAGA